MSIAQISETCPRRFNGAIRQQKPAVLSFLCDNPDAPAAHRKDGERSRATMPTGLLILWPGRRQILWLGVTAHPTAEWMARQLPEAYEGERTLDLVRDHDRVYGEVFTRRRAFVIGRLRHARHGRMGMRNG